MSESSCFAKRVGSVQVIEKQGLAQVAAEAHEVETTSTSRIGSLYIAIDTFSKSPRIVIKHCQVRQRRGDSEGRGEYVHPQPYRQQTPLVQQGMADGSTE